MSFATSANLPSSPEQSGNSSSPNKNTDTDYTLTPTSAVAHKNESKPSLSNQESSLSSELPADIEGYQANESDDNFSITGANIARTESHAVSSINISRVLTNADKIERKATEKNLEGIPLAKMGGGRPYPSSLPNIEDYTVAFDGPDDPLHPHNWPLRKKIIQCAIIGYVCLMVAFGSSCFSAAVLPISEIFHVATVVATLGISFYVFGFATGPIVWAPLSEIYGRKYVLFISTFLFTIFNFAVACSDRLESVLICRFFAGCLGAAPMVVVPASFADIFGNRTRGTAMVIFSMAVFSGPMMAPFIGYFTVGRLGWRWASFLPAILVSPMLVAIPFFLNESHHPIILVEKARELKRRTGNWGIHAPHDQFNFSFQEIVENNLSRPIKMLLTEPILLFITIYNSFIYGMVYLFLTAYPIVFSLGYKMVNGVAELPYFGLILGQLLGGLFCIWCEKGYVRKLEANNGKIVPEARLPPMIVGAVAFPIGLLWFCWTGYYHDKIHWIVPTISGLFTGFGIMVIFIPSLNYIIDSYLLFAASAMAANTFLRSAFGGAFPIFAEFMFKGMHTNWAGLLLGLFAVVLIACPLLFVKYGKRLRQSSKFAFDLN